MAVGDETLRDFSASPVDALLGTVVGEYRVEALIGSGSMGNVYRAVQTVIRKPVALKVLKPDYSNDPDMVDRLKHEAITVCAIRHPAIIDVHGFGNLPSGQPYIVMDLLDGEPMDAFIRRDAPIAPKVALPLLDDLLGGLGAAHSVGVIHRDLKPGNIFVEKHPDAKSHIKIIDFGLARQSTRAGGSVRPTQPGTLLGTPAFMAPEQVMGQKVTPATDLYAVGGIAYQLLTGHLPHEAPNAIEVIAQKMQHDPLPPSRWNPKLDAEIEHWVLGLLRQRAEERPQSAEEVRLSLRRIVDGRTQGSVVPVRRSHASLQRVAVHSKKVESVQGVVPRVEDKTVIGLEGVVDPSEKSTDERMSPYAQTTARYGQVDVTPLEKPAVEPRRGATDKEPLLQPDSPALSKTLLSTRGPARQSDTVIATAPEELRDRPPTTGAWWPWLAGGAVAAAALGLVIWGLFH